MTAQPAASRQDRNLNATLWVQTSAEYAALTAALADPHLDLDETVLDNSSAQVQVIGSGLGFTEKLDGVGERSAGVSGGVSTYDAVKLKYAIRRMRTTQR